jgi:hypothetical protein
VAKGELEVVEIAGKKGLARADAPLPPRDAPRGDVVGPEDQVPVPVGVPTSTPRERVREVAGVDGHDELLGAGRRHA